MPKQDFPRFLLQGILLTPVSTHEALQGLGLALICVPQKFPGVHVKLCKWSPRGPSYLVR